MQVLLIPLTPDQHTEAAESAVLAQFPGAHLERSSWPSVREKFRTMDHDLCRDYGRVVFVFPRYMGLGGWEVDKALRRWRSPRIYTWDRTLGLRSWAVGHWRRALRVGLIRCGTGLVVTVLRLAEWLGKGGSRG